MRKLAHVEKIASINPIEGADRIEVATVLGWQVVVKKDEFKVGDRVIYIEIDSRVPKDNPYFAFLADRNYKVKSIKLMKQISQGLIMPMNLLPPGEYEVGTDVTEILGIKKIEEDFTQPKFNKEDELKRRHRKLTNKKWFKYLMKYEWFRNVAFKFLLPKKKNSGWPAWIVKTDEERVQNMPWVLNNKEPFMCTEKLDGTSTTFSLHKEGRKWRFYVCSRNVVQEDINQKNYHSTDDIGNVYWEMAIKYEIEKVLYKLVKDLGAKEYVTIQGETIGEGIQKNKYELKGRDFYVFNIIYDDIKMTPNLVDTHAETNGLKSVPILSYDYIMPNTIDELMEFATGTSKLHNTLREGIVFRNYDMSISFKCVSNKFLMKWNL